MDFEKIVAKLGGFKLELEGLKAENHSVGRAKVEVIHNKIIMIIRRVYPNPEEVIKQLFPGGFFVYTDDELQRQKRYLSDLDDELRALETILEEFELFGFDKFTPIKKEIEDEYVAKVKGFGFSRKIKKS